MSVRNIAYYQEQKAAREKVARDYTFVNWKGKNYRISLNSGDKTLSYLPSDWQKIAGRVDQLVDTYEKLPISDRMDEFKASEVKEFSYDIAQNKISFSLRNQAEGSPDTLEVVAEVQNRIQPDLDALKQVIAAATPVSFEKKPPESKKASTLQKDTAQLKAKDTMLTTKTIEAALAPLKSDHLDVKTVDVTSAKVSDIQTNKQGKLLLPLYIPGKKRAHCAGLMIDFTAKEISYYDSAGTALKKRKNVKKFVEDLNQEYFNGQGTVISTVRKQQTDNYNCGRYLLDYYYARLSSTSHDAYIVQEISETDILQKMDPIVEKMQKHESHEALRGQIAKEGHFWFSAPHANRATGFLSMDFPAKITLSNHGAAETYENATAAILAQQFDDARDRKEFETLSASDARTKSEALIQANKRRAVYGSDEEKQSYQLVLKEKFTQNAALKDLLLATENHYIHHRNTLDEENRVGRLLMKIRGELGGSGRVAPPANVTAQFPHAR